MKHLFNKLSAFLVMLMCMSATVQAAIVHHEVCDPTYSTRGFTCECWEDTETGMFYYDANCTKSMFIDEILKSVIYKKLPTSPVDNSSGFNFYEDIDFMEIPFNRAATTIMNNISKKYVEYKVKEENISNARIIWAYQHSGSNACTSLYDITIFINDQMAENRIMINNKDIITLPTLKQNDVIKFEIVCRTPEASIGWDNFNVNLEYTFDCHHEFPQDRRTCSKCGYTLPEHVVCHYVCQPTDRTIGFTTPCWEDTNNGKLYSDPFLTNELTGAELAKTVVYEKLQECPVTGNDGFNIVEHDNVQTWGVQLNWAAEATFANTSEIMYPTRYVEFKVGDGYDGNARLVWMKNQGAPEQGRFTVNIYVNDALKQTYNQNNYENMEGVVVVPLPELKQGDIVKFEILQNSYASYAEASPTFKACLEYTACKHEYPTGSAICSKCGKIKAHDHNYVKHECTLCGQIESGFMFGYVGNDADCKNIMWELNTTTNVLTFTGSGEMEVFNAEHNAWRNEYQNVITKVIIGEGITNIGEYAGNDLAYFFEMSGLTDVFLPSTLKTIGSYAFYKCSSLTSITLPEGLLSIDRYAFVQVPLQSITLPSTLKVIERDAFWSSNIQELIIPASVTLISQNAFLDNHSLTKVIINGNTTINYSAFGRCTNLQEIYLMSKEQTPANNDAFCDVNTDNITLHVNNEQIVWAKNTGPWNRFGKIVPFYNLEYTDVEGVKHLENIDTEASDNTFTITDGAYKNLTIYEDIPMQTLTYTRNFSAANTWQALYVPFEMAYSDWTGKFDVAAITNFHEYTDENGETEKIELEVRYVKNGKLRANTPYLIRAKAAGEQTIVLNGVTLQTTVSKSIDCRSTEREYTFTGTYEAIDGLQTKDYIFVSGGRLCKAGNDTDVLKPMRWYLTITERGSMTINPSPALAKPISIHVIGEDDTTGIEEITVVSSSLNVKASGIYSISGVKLAKPQKGINIVNGKKVNVR